MTWVTININAKLMPMDRGEMFEDKITEIMEQEGIKGSVDGGGTLLADNGEIASIDVEMNLEENIEASLKIIEDKLVEFVGIPKGSSFQYDDKNISVGTAEGIGVYYDLTKQEFHKERIQSFLNETWDTIGEGKAYYTSSMSTDDLLVINFYGKTYNHMEEVVREMIKKYPQDHITFKRIA